MSFGTYFLVDRSASMGGKMDEVVGSLNTFVSELKKDKPKKARLTVVSFDDTSYDVIRDSVKFKDWTDITVGEVTPRGMTPLNDSIAKLANQILKDDPDRAVLTILTDGAENCSKEYSHAAAKELLDKLRAKGYEVQFVGADFDNQKQASDYGNMRGKTLNVTSGNRMSHASSLAAKTAAYASSGKSVDWTEEERNKFSS